jgi:hypothetical protein
MGLGDGGSSAFRMTTCGWRGLLLLLSLVGLVLHQQLLLLH